MEESVGKDVAQEFQKVVEAKLAQTQARAPPLPPPSSVPTTGGPLRAARTVSTSSSRPEMVNILLRVKTGEEKNTLSILAPDPASDGNTFWPVASLDGTAAIPILPSKSVPSKTEAGEKRIPLDIPRRCLQGKPPLSLNLPNFA